MLIDALQHASKVCNHLRGVNRQRTFYRCAFDGRTEGAGNGETRR
jgi:hypothetical protein